jgi:hypothetical protein
MRDGGLTGIFRKQMPHVHWQPVETWSTGQGVPDLNGCVSGAEFWIEMKQTKSNKVKIEPEQVAWAERRLRAGGRVFLAVRLHCDAGPRKEAKDELHLFRSNDARAIMLEGLSAIKATPLVLLRGGPAKWDWAKVQRVLTTA